MGSLGWRRGAEPWPSRLADAVWLRLEAPDNLMVIHALLELDGELPLEVLRRRCRERLPAHPRLFMRPRPPWGGVGPPRWVPDPSFRWERHLDQAVLAEGSRAALLAWISARMSEPLARSRSPWRIHLLQRPGQGTAALVRVHHCLADGRALLGLLQELSDEGPAAGEASLGEREHRRLEAFSWARPGRPWRLPRLLGRHLGALASLLRLAALPPERNPLKGELGLEQGAALSGSWPLDRLGQAARREGVTLHEWLLAALAGALSRYLGWLDRGPVPARVRAILPFDLGGGGARPPLGNRVGLAFLPLPVGEAGWGARLAQVRARMGRLRDAPEAVAVFALAAATVWLPEPWQRWIAGYLGDRATLVVSSLRGPSRTLHLEGRPLARVAFWVPRAGRVSLGVSFLRYAGQLSVGVAGDAGRVPEPARLAEAWGEEVSSRLAPSPRDGAGAVEPGPG